MKKMLAIDLGITTGYAVFKLDDSQDPIEYGEIGEDDLESRLKELLSAHMISYSVCEDPVIIRGSLGMRLQAQLFVVNKIFPYQVKHVTPAQWKQTPYSKTPCPRGTSPHVKDATRLGRWYKNTLKKSLQQD